MNLHREDLWVAAGGLSSSANNGAARDGQMSDLMDDPAVQHMATWLFRHLLALGWVDQTPAEGYPHGIPCYASGFVLSVDEHWFWVTAGHIVEWIRQDLKKGKVLTDWHLYDRETVEPGGVVPFAWREDRAFGFDVDGADYGVVYLSPYYCRLLQKGSLVVFDEQAWYYGVPEDCDTYLLLGIPAETVGFAGGGTRVEMQKVALGIDRLPGPPPGVGPSQFPRFCGKLKETGPLDSIRGMSGGPIMGFKRMPDGTLRHWIVALQSRWIRSARVVIGCPIRSFAQWIAVYAIPRLGLEPGQA